MDVDPEEDVCRICAAPGDENQPLFHPCKCSGTIRYIHQDCLATWLQHSKKTTCDVCKHKFAFTKVYDPKMPRRLPLVLFLRRFSLQLSSFGLLILRGALVGLVWLAMLPYSTVWTWRFFFWSGDALSWFIAGRPPPPYNMTNTILVNATSEVVNGTSTALPKTRVHPMLRTLSSDIFTGQIITSVIVLLFLSLFLLREWIFQNAPAENLALAEGQAEEEAAPEVDLQQVVEDGLREVNRVAAEAMDRIDREPIDRARAMEMIERLRRDRRAAHAHAEGDARDGPVEDLPHEEPEGSEAESLERRDSQARADSSVEQGGVEEGGRSDEGGDLHEPGPSDPTFKLPPREWDEAEHEAAKRHAEWEDAQWSAGDQDGDPSVPPPLRDTDRESQPSDLDEYFPEREDVTAGPSQNTTLEQAWEDMPSLIPPSISQPTVSDDSFDLMDAANGTSPAAELVSLPSHSTESSEWQVTGDDAGAVASQKRRASMSSTSPQHEDPPSTVWSNVLIDGKPRAKRRKTINADDIGDQSVDVTNGGAEKAEDSGVTSSVLSDGLARGVKRAHADVDDSADEASARKRRDSRAQQPPTLSPVRLPAGSRGRHRSTPKRPPTPWTRPRELMNSSDSDDEHEPDSSDHPQIPPLVVKTAPSPDEKGKERAAPPPRIALRNPDGAQEDGLLSPSRVSPRRPGLPPSLPTPMHRPGHRHGSDAASPTASGSRTRHGDSPGRASYRAPEDMDYFGDVEETDLSANDAPPKAPGADDVDGELLNPPARDLTVNVANPEPDEPAEQPAAGNADEPAVVLADEPQPLVIMNNELAELAAAADGEGREAGMDDDMDGALEAVGMRGPLHQLFQNVALMMCILDVFIGAAVFLPFIIGKSAALLSLDHRRALLIVNLPLKLIRIFTDPVVDFAAMLFRNVFAGLRRLLVPPFLWAWAAGPWARWAKELSILHSKESTSTSSTSFLKDTVWRNLNATVQTYSTSAVSYFDSAFDAHPSAEESFATLGAFIRHVKPHLRELRISWKEEFRRFIEKDTVLSRAFAILLGYSLIAVTLGIWMQSTKQQQIKGFAKSLRNTVYQQLLVAKVAFFIVVELLLFPLGCGIVMDLCTMPLFADATVVKRVAFAVYAPVTSLFLHWTLGTMFMFQFATLLDYCRHIMRPGALWFLKDPQDPSYSPIQEILGRPAFSQVRKLFMSAVMYCFVIFAGIGSVIWFLRHFRPFQGLLPLRWNMHEPISEIPIDLLFVHYVVPATVKQLKLRRYAKEIIVRLWKRLAAKLRLTSYMFGGRYPEEERSVNLRLFFPPKQIDVLLEPDGGLFRVPANDQVLLIPNIRVVVPLDWDEQPVDDDARERLQRQDDEARQTGRNPQDDYTVVYLPPHFGRRVMMFTFLLWLYGMTGIVAFITIPLLTGRMILDGVLDHPVHDGYAFGVGFHVLAVAFLLGRSLFRVISRRPNLSAIPMLAKRLFYGTIWLLKMTWLLFAFNVILPVLAGVALELHVVLPVKFVMHPLRTPVFHVVENWACGVVLCRIAARLLRLRRAPMINIFDEARANGWANPQAWRLTKSVILPLVLLGLGVNLIPANIARCAIRLGFFKEHPIVLYRLIYPFWVMTMCQTLLLMRLFDLIGMWVQTVRDKEFLVELRLRNLDN